MKVLEVDDSKWGKITVDGRAVLLPAKQFSLIRLLAAWPGSCVSYRRICEAVWDKKEVEDGKISLLLENLLRRVGRAVPDRAEMVVTVPQKGLLLNLRPHEIALALRTRKETPDWSLEAR